jgi:hypothetical protein
MSGPTLRPTEAAARKAIEVMGQFVALVAAKPGPTP